MKTFSKDYDTYKYKTAFTFSFHITLLSFSISFANCIAIRMASILIVFYEIKITINKTAFVAKSCIFETL